MQVQPILVNSESLTRDLKKVDRDVLPTNSIKYDSISFNANKNVFKEAFQAKVSTKLATQKILKMLVEDYKSQGKDIVINKSFLKLYDKWQNGNIEFETFLSTVCRESNTGKTAISKNDGTILAAVGYKSLDFFDPVSTDILTWEIKSPANMEFIRNSNHWRELIKFHPSSNVIKTRKLVSGRGFSKGSETTHYDERGKKRPIRNFFAFFGI